MLASTNAIIVILTKDIDKENLKRWDNLGLEDQKALFKEAIQKIKDEIKNPEHIPITIMGWEKMFHGSARGGSLTHPEKKDLKTFLQNLARENPNFNFIINLKSISDIKDPTLPTTKKISRREKIAAAYAKNPFAFSSDANFRFQFFHLLETPKEKKMVVYSNTTYIFSGEKVFSQRKTHPFARLSYDYNKGEPKKSEILEIFHPAEENPIFSLQNITATVKICRDFGYNLRIRSEIPKNQNASSALVAFITSDGFSLKSLRTQPYQWSNEEVHIFADSREKYLIAFNALSDGIKPQTYEFSLEQGKIQEIRQESWLNLAKIACETLEISEEELIKLPKDIQSLAIQNPGRLKKLLGDNKISITEIANALTNSDLVELFYLDDFFRSFINTVARSQQNAKAVISYYKNFAKEILMITFLPYQMLAKAFIEKNLSLAKEVFSFMQQPACNNFRDKICYLPELINILKLILLHKDQTALDLFAQYVQESEINFITYEILSYFLQNKCLDELIKLTAGIDTLDEELNFITVIEHFLVKSIKINRIDLVFYFLDNFYSTTAEKMIITYDCLIKKVVETFANKTLRETYPDWEKMIHALEKRKEQVPVEDRPALLTAS